MDVELKLEFWSAAEVPTVQRVKIELEHIVSRIDSATYLLHYVID